MTPDDLEPLSNELQSLLQAERVAPGASTALKARMFERLSGSLFPGIGTGGGGGGEGGQSGGGAAHVAGGAGSGAVAWGTAAVTKLAVGVGLASFAVGGFVGAGVHAVATPQPTPPPAVAAQSPRPAEEVPAVVPVLAVPLPPMPESVKPVNVHAVKPPPKPTADTLGDERSYLEQARSAMARRDPSAALAALADHERRFPLGQLAEERMALQILALAGEGRGDEAKALATRFRGKYPTSLPRGAVDSAAP